MDDKLLTYQEQLIKRRELLKQSLEDYEDLIERTGVRSSIEFKHNFNFDGLKLKDQEMYLDKKMQELLIIEGQLLHRRNELENKQKHLCTLLNTTPLDSNLPISLVQLNQKLQDHIKMLSELRVNTNFPSRLLSNELFLGSTFNSSVFILSQIKRIFRTVRMDTIISIITC